MAFKAKVFFAVGTKFERLTVVGPAYIEVRGPVDKPRKLRCYPCECTCGTKKGVPPSELTSGRTRSCGCLHQELRPLVLRTHGASGSPLYLVLMNMIARCEDPDIGETYKNYGGRGISVCPEWRHDFVAFRDWALSHGYKPGLTIERKDVNGHYSPENCEWIPKVRQSRNRRNTPQIAYLGEEKTRAEWGRDPRCAVCQGTFLDRLKEGWSFEEAFTTPKRGTLGPGTLTHLFL